MENKNANYVYAGAELETFRLAVNWKKYVFSILGKYIRGDVCEAGAGIGANTEIVKNLAGGNVSSWLCIEPDAAQSARIEELNRSGRLGKGCSVQTGTIGSLPPGSRFDTIIYIDVLEHIDNDRAELAHAAGLLSPGGHIVTLSPAHMRLFSRFDESIGHFRRYNLESIDTLAPAGCRLVEKRYADSLGAIALALNKYLLHRPPPDGAQVVFWDSYFVPVTRIMDIVFRNIFGKSVIAVWRKEA